MIELVALDMAGTTIDDHGAVYVALEKSVLETGATVNRDDLQTWMGTDKVAAITALMTLGGEDASGERVETAFGRFREILAEFYESTPPVALPGVVEALTELRDRGVAVALTTGFSDDVAQPLLASLGWTVGFGAEHLLDAVVTTTDVAAGRPAPYLIHHAMECTGVRDVRNVLAAGDTVVDVQAARNAGVVSVGVLTGALDRAAFEGAPYDHLLDGVADLPALIASL